MGHYGRTDHYHYVALADPRRRNRVDIDLIAINMAEINGGSAFFRRLLQLRGIFTIS